MLILILVLLFLAKVFSVLSSLTILNFMTKIIGIRKPYGMMIRKKFGDPKASVSGGYYGEANFGDGGFGSTDPDPNAWFYGIYQQRRCKDGIRCVQMKFYKPTNPNTFPQQVQRAKLATAVSVWQGLTEQEKQVYNRNALGKPLSGYQLFCKEYILSI